MVNLEALLPAAHIIRMDVPPDFDSLISTICAPLEIGGMITDRDQFAADLKRREAQCTTVVDDGLVAFPHARSGAVKRLAVAVGLVEEPGFILHPDGKLGTRVFFCIAVPAFAPAAHLQLLQRLAAFARERKRLEKLLATRTPAAAARCLHGFKG